MFCPTGCDVLWLVSPDAKQLVPYGLPMQEAVAVPMTFTVGSHVWVEDEGEAWVPGVVVSRHGQRLKVKIGSKLVGALPCAPRAPLPLLPCRSPFLPSASPPHPTLLLGPSQLVHEVAVHLREADSSGARRVPQGRGRPVPWALLMPLSLVPHHVGT